MFEEVAVVHVDTGIIFEPGDNSYRISTVEVNGVFTPLLCWMRLPTISIENLKLDVMQVHRMWHLHHHAGTIDYLPYFSRSTLDSYINPFEIHTFAIDR